MYVAENSSTERTAWSEPSEDLGVFSRTLDKGADAVVLCNG